MGCSVKTLYTHSSYTAHSLLIDIFQDQNDKKNILKRRLFKKIKIFIRVNSRFNVYNF